MTTPGAPATEPARCDRNVLPSGMTLSAIRWAAELDACCDGDEGRGFIRQAADVLAILDRLDHAEAALSARSSSTPLNTLEQLPSGLTLAALRERAVLFGGNGCEVPAPDLLCLLDALQEARGVVERSDEIANALSVAEAENRRLETQMSQAHDMLNRLRQNSDRICNWFWHNDPDALKDDGVTDAVLKKLTALDNKAHQLATDFSRCRAERDEALNQRWDATCAPGGYVCATCGVPVESEPCPDHEPRIPS